MSSTAPAQSPEKNHLDSENSLYLRQHADQAVHWHPWGQAAFDLAQAQNKPVLVSVGYASCHWCHVMAKECFDDTYIAELMNRYFVCIKVDREEHPEVDQTYIDAVQMIHGSAGWPLNVFCFPDKKPFYGGTYFPPEDRGQGVMPWPQLLMRVAEHYQSHQSELRENAENIAQNLVLANKPGGCSCSKVPYSNAQLIDVAKKICEQFDPTHGGFGGAPKFPPFMTLDFLLELHSTNACKTQETQLRAQIRNVCYNTLLKIGNSGLFDQVDGGCFRYTVDEAWSTPHYEKMLYDQALGLNTYLKAYQLFKEERFKELAEGIIEATQRQFSTNCPLWASSLSADSEEGEGRFYQWSFAELCEILGPSEAQAFAKDFSINPQDSTAQLPIYKGAGNSPHPRFSEALAKLAKVGQQRRSPEKDGKAILIWNCLFIQGLAQAGFYLGKVEFLQKAQAPLEFILSELYDAKTQALLPIYYPDAKQQGALVVKLSDYVALANACLSLARYIDVLEPGKSAHYIARAKGLTQHALAHFCDPEHPGYFQTGPSEAVVAPKKEWLDSSLPCAQSSLLKVLFELQALEPSDEIEAAIKEIQTGYAPLLAKIGHAAPNALSALTQGASGVVVSQRQSMEEIQALWQEAQSKPFRNRFFVQSH